MVRLGPPYTKLCLFQSRSAKANVRLDLFLRNWVILTAGIVLPSPRRSAGSVILELNGLTPELPFRTLGHLMVCRSGMMREARTMKHVKLTEHNNGCRTHRRAMDHYQLCRESEQGSACLRWYGDARKAALRLVCSTAYAHTRGKK